ncbi:MULTISPECIES: bifunctional 2-methylcitrate synthase/citrate synthase [unclassified Brevibacterium]|uniref:bifunctional 2-methylcitrate synthase/citrate synthase n=1 Tax=unclassified Brevibacterium TaxID=2614124 RepID=UPI001E350D47|nr:MULTISPECIES: bifunctional 2-methylcitrate synthase/citrate synthase [unclassified Brevibacterium]MCD1287083.1 2-methylcitrate synthase [Brevibacterium sp. CCUG 69071]MDK8436312.1 bifunctional 2-methylcitrate synthase/citrate synthase [Brevibacterium sp. H-BE7]
MTEEIKKGLAGVVVDTTAVSKVVQETNSLTYRGYPVQELAAKRSFEDVAYLIWNGELPTEAQLEEFKARERSQRTVDDRLVQLILDLPKDCHPMHVVQTAVSYLGAVDPEADVEGEEANLAKAERLYAQLPTIVAIDHRRRHGLDPVAPTTDLGYAANFFKMVFDEVPDEAVVRCFDISMILYAEHSFNASTFTTRVITSTTADLYSAVAGGVGALKGPLHGGANEAVMAMLEEVGTADKASAWIDDALAKKAKIMGFGHRVYKNGDSRVPTMRKAFENMVEAKGATDLLDLYNAFEEDFVGRKGIYPNLDYPSGPAYHLMGFDTDQFTPIFVMARITGWTAHIMEQQANNALIRPLSAYDGEEQREVPDNRG